MHDVICPRCGEHTVTWSPRGAFVAFCVRQVAFLLPEEFDPIARARLKTCAIAAPDIGSDVPGGGAI